MITYRQHAGTPIGYSTVYTVLQDGNPVGEIRKTEPPIWAEDKTPVFEAYSITGQKLGTGKSRMHAAAHITG